MPKRIISVEVADTNGSMTVLMSAVTEAVGIIERAGDVVDVSIRDDES